VIATEARRPRRALTATVLTLLVVPLGACTSHGTDAIYTPAVGVNARSDSAAVLNAMIVSGEPGEGRLIAGLSNVNQSEGDELTGITGVEEDASVQVELGGPVELPPAGFTQIADMESSEEGGQITVRGEAVEPGAFIRLSLEFANAAPVEVHAPVVSPGEDYSDVVSASPTESETEPPSESETEAESSAEEAPESE
jgi:hypothetical protein